MLNIILALMMPVLMLSEPYPLEGLPDIDAAGSNLDGSPNVPQRPFSRYVHAPQEALQLAGGPIDIAALDHLARTDRKHLISLQTFLDGYKPEHGVTAYSGILATKDLGNLVLTNINSTNPITLAELNFLLEHYASRLYSITHGKEVLNEDIKDLSVLIAQFIDDQLDRYFREGHHNSPGFIFVPKDTKRTIAEFISATTFAKTPLINEMLALRAVNIMELDMERTPSLLDPFIFACYNQLRTTPGAMVLLGREWEHPYKLAESASVVISGLRTSPDANHFAAFSGKYKSKAHIPGKGMFYNDVYNAYFPPWWLETGIFSHYSYFLYSAYLHDVAVGDHFRAPNVRVANLFAQRNTALDSLGDLVRSGMYSTRYVEVDVLGSRRYIDSRWVSLKYNADGTIKPYINPSIAIPGMFLQNIMWTQGHAGVYNEDGLLPRFFALRSNVFNYFMQVMRDDSAYENIAYAMADLETLLKVLTDLTYGEGTYASIDMVSPNGRSLAKMVELMSAAKLISPGLS